MEFVRSLAPFIDHEKFAASLNGGRHLHQLFNLIRSNRVANDEEAIAELYGGRGGADAYKQLRLRLEQKLVDYIASNGITHKSLDLYVKRYRECLHQLSVFKTLMLSIAQSVGAKLGEKLIRHAIKYEFTDVAMLVAQDLYYYYSCTEHLPRKAVKYEHLVKSLDELYSIELMVFQCYCNMRTLFTVSRGGYQSRVMIKSTEYFNEVKDVLKTKRRTFRLLYYGYRVLTMYFEMHGDTKNLLRTCDEALRVIEGRDVTRAVAIYIFKAIKIICFIKLKRYKEVETIADRSFSFMTNGSINWLGLKSYIVVNRLHAGNYQDSYEAMHEMTSNRSYQKLPQYLLQTFTVYEAHVEFLIAIGRVKTDEPSRFRLNKFLNEIPIYTKDKQGMNIAILIIHVLFLLHRRKYGQIIDRTDALKQYGYRYLKKDDTYRSHCFIRMLLQMPRADFNRMRTVRYAEPYLKKLNAMPLHLSAQSIEVEIIPYEALWEMTLELLH